MILWAERQHRLAKYGARVLNPSSSSNDVATNASYPKICAVVTGLYRLRDRVRCRKLNERIDCFTGGAPTQISRAETPTHIMAYGVGQRGQRGQRGQISAPILFNEMTPTKDGFTTYLDQVGEAFQEDSSLV